MNALQNIRKRCPGLLIACANILRLGQAAKLRQEGRGIKKLHCGSHSGAFPNLLILKIRSYELTTQLPHTEKGALNFIPTWILKIGVDREFRRAKNFRRRQNGSRVNSCDPNHCRNPFHSCKGKLSEPYGQKYSAKFYLGESLIFLINK